MKKIAFFIGYFIFSIFMVYASGSTDDQSQALLFKQKRVRRDNAPESAVFYECYLLNTIDEKGDSDSILLDTYLKDNIILINLDSSMKIVVTNTKEMLKQNEVIYNCIVLYSNAMFGIAVVNVFEAKPINQQVGYIINDKLFNTRFVNENDSNYLGFVYYGLDSNGLDNNVFVYFPQSKRTILQLDQWPMPTKFNVLDGLSLSQKAYNIMIANENNEMRKREYKKMFDQFYIELSRLNLLKL